MRQLAEQVEAHVRLEERSLFPLIELVPQEELAELGLEPSARAGSAAVDLLAPVGSGPL